MSDLTEQECEEVDAILVALWQCETERGYDHMSSKALAAVERIVAAREAALAERIAQAIEASADRRDPTGKQYADESQGLLRAGFVNGLDHAARIAREIGGQS